ncbi:uncharacterized protein LOC117151651 [Bombus impatiens]|uniref:Uncharacterized protein LOC117151651 n=1 Tax=Bombus impatiens TaxID=132113 RepID=A0A6P8KZL8_BOMIM|nr:uncharacterized protein LOC117151651 [Bombus impatiens]
MGYGAILLQRDSEDNAFHPVYYSSGKTSLAEEKYTSYEFEVLAIVKALKKFRVYLLGIPFKIVTDCQAFALTMQKGDLCVRVARWAILLEKFDYKVEHRPGSSMMHVDALSRNPLPEVMLIDKDERGIFVWLYPTKSTGSAEVISRLRKQSVNFGNPRRIISDRGTAFTAGAFKDYCREEGIQHVRTTTGIPRANGQVERVNRTLIPLLTKLSAPTPDKWFKHLETAQRYLNAAPNVSTNAAPFQLLFGTRMRLRDDPQISQLIEDEQAAVFQKERDQLRADAKRRIEEIQIRNKRAYNRRRKKATAYRTGDLVAIERMQRGPGLKLHPKFLGPYRVIKVL